MGYLFWARDVLPPALLWESELETQADRREYWRQCYIKYNRADYFREHYRKNKDRIKKRRNWKYRERTASHHAQEKIMRLVRAEAKATGGKLSDIMERMGMPKSQVDKFRRWGR